MTRIVIQRELTEADVDEVLRAYLYGDTQQSIAQRFGVSRTTVARKINKHKRRIENAWGRGAY